MPLQPLSDRELRQRIVKLVAATRLRLPEVPTTKDIEEIFGLEVSIDTLPQGKEGAYVSNRIILNKLTTSAERRRFTLFHELVHHLIREEEDLLSDLHETYRDNSAFEKAVEMLCNVGAAEFILPMSKVKELTQEQPFSLNLIPILCAQNDASGPATLIQLIQSAYHECYAVICDVGIPPISTDARQGSFAGQVQSPALFIQLAIWSPGARYSLARYTPIRKHHLLQEGITAEKLIKGKDSIPFKSGTVWEVDCEVLRFRSSVYGLFNAEPPLSHLQRSLF